MRAPFGSAVFTATVFAATLVLSQEDGYYAEEPDTNDPVDFVETNITCPSDKFIRTREICNEDGIEVPCIRVQCCETHQHVAGRCIPKSVDPCSLQLCEQACQVQGERLWCSCLQGFKFDANHYKIKRQPYCVDVDECQDNNGGCEQDCINDPGGYHCECMMPYSLAADGKKCERSVPLIIPSALPLVRASSRCYATCDNAAWLSRKVKQLTDQLHTTQTALKKIMQHPVFRDEWQSNRLPRDSEELDSMAPLKGGYCRCERGPRGPAGPPGMEGPKGDMGPRGPRGHRGPKGSMDLMLLLLADVKHDIRNLEARIYKNGETPERFNLQKAWRKQRKQEKMELESGVEQDLEAYTVPAIEISNSPVEISPNGATGEIPQTSPSTSYKELAKGETEPVTLGLPLGIDEKLKELHRLASTMKGITDDDDGLDTDYDYSFY